MNSSHLHVHPANQSYSLESVFVGEINANSAFIFSVEREKKKEKQEKKCYNSEPKL